MGDSRGRDRYGKELVGAQQGQAFVWDVEADAGDDQNNNILVGKIWASKSINAKAAIETMINLWNPTKAISGNMVDSKEKTFIFKFESERDKARVLEGQPWHFDKFVWCFNEPNNNGKLSDVPLYHFPMWVRVYDLPILGRTSLSNVQNIAASLGGYVDVDRGEGRVLDRALRIRVLVDVRQPLRASVPIIMRDGHVVQFRVTYERLPTFCYGCGILGHREKDCEQGPYEEDDLLFGSWLRASPWKVTKTSRDEGGKARRALNADFEALRHEEEEGSLNKMIETLQSISLNLKSKALREKAANRMDFDPRGDSRAENYERVQSGWEQNTNRGADPRK